jgi:hypothetical protein
VLRKKPSLLEYSDRLLVRARPPTSPPAGPARLAQLGQLLSLILLLWGLPSPVQAQDSPITAAVNKTHYSTDELVILTVTVVDDSALQPRPILSRLDGLAVIDLDISTDVGLVNGKIHTEVTYTYRLQPRRTGTLTIPPVTVKIDGEIFKAAPLSLEVSQGAPPAPSSGNTARPANITPPAALQGQDFYIESQLDPSNPYLGQQLIYTFRFYQAIQVYRQPEYDGPLFTGFESMGLPVRQYNLDVNDRTYLITEIRTALFAKSPGRLTIGPARMMFPGNIYEEPVEMYTEPLTLEVKPLPGNAPPEFSGAVGQFKIESSLSPQVAIVTQPSTLFVALSGTGNIQALPEPLWPELNGWRIFESLSSLTTDTSPEGQMTGTRMFERLVVADQTGEYTIPPAKYVYFDPVAGEYRTITSASLAVKVIPAPTPEPTPSAVATPAATAVTALSATTPLPDQQTVKPGLVDLPATRPALTWPVMGLLFIGLCGALPLAAVLGAGGVWWWQRRRTRGPAPLASKSTHQELRQPGQKIHPSLAAAMRINDDNYKTVSQALHHYLSDMLQLPVHGLTRTELARRLGQRGVSQGLIERIEGCLAQSEMSRFGPTSDDAGWSLMAETDALLRELDGAIRD